MCIEFIQKFLRFFHLCDEDIPEVVIISRIEFLDNGLDRFTCIEVILCLGQFHGPFEGSFLFLEIDALPPHIQKELFCLPEVLVGQLLGLYIPCLFGPLGKFRKRILKIVKSIEGDVVFHGKYQVIDPFHFDAHVPYDRYVVSHLIQTLPVSILVV